jgi:hypothetical protein
VCDGTFGNWHGMPIWNWFRISARPKRNSSFLTRQHCCRAYKTANVEGEFRALMYRRAMIIYESAAAVKKNFEPSAVRCRDAQVDESFLAYRKVVQKASWRKAINSTVLKCHQQQK